MLVADPPDTVNLKIGGVDARAGGGEGGGDSGCAGGEGGGVVGLLAAWAGRQARRAVGWWAEGQEQDLEEDGLGAAALVERELVVSVLKAEEAQAGLHQH